MSYTWLHSNHLTNLSFQQQTTPYYRILKKKNEKEMQNKNEQNCSYAKKKSGRESASYFQLEIVLS